MTMKKEVLFWTLLAYVLCIPLIAHWVKPTDKRIDPDAVIMAAVDQRGLISIQYIQGQDTLAQDYLTWEEYNNLIKSK